MRIDITPRQIKSFWSKVSVGGTDDCWEWQASLNNKGYGRFMCGLKWQHKGQGAHRVSYVLAHGEIPDDRPVIMHICDNPRCVNPNHLVAGTMGENAIDRDSKGRGPQQTGKMFHGRGEQNGMSKLTDDLVREIRRRCASGETGRSIATDLGISFSLVSQVKKRQIWKHV